MVFFVFRLFSWLPLWFLHLLGVLVGGLVYGFSPKMRRQMRQHFDALYPGQPLGRKHILRASALHSGMMLMELPFLWGRSRRKGVLACSTVVDWQVIEQAERQGKGIVFLTPHLGCFECTAQIFSSHAPITVLYRPHRRPDVQQIMESSRQRSNVALAATTFAGVRKLIRALRQGQAVGMLPDQVPAVGEGVALDLGGHHAYTMTLPAALHASTGAPVVLAVGLRKPFWGFELRLFAGPADLSPDITQATRQINEAMVKLIKQYPNQYYWAYERFRPPRGVQTWEELFEKEPLKPAAPQGGCRSAPESFQGESSE